MVDVVLNMVVVRKVNVVVNMDGVVVILNTVPPPMVVNQNLVTVILKVIILKVNVEKAMVNVHPVNVVVNMDGVVKAKIIVELDVIVTLVNVTKPINKSNDESIHDLKSIKKILFLS